MTAYGKISPPPVSYQDVLDAPEGTVAEIVDGMFYLQAQPAPPHQELAGNLLTDLKGLFQRGRGGPGGWWIVGEPELHFGDPDYRTLVPDLAGWQRERLHAVPKRWADLTVTPDWVCEIVSPSTARLDRTEKMRVYAEVGIPHLWMIDPLAKTLEVFQLREGRWTLMSTHAGEDEAAAIPFDAVPLALADLWIEDGEDDAG